MVMEALHKILPPFLFRRVQADVEKNALSSKALAHVVWFVLITHTEKEINLYAGLAKMQREWYRSVLENDTDTINGKERSRVLGGG
jgi:SWI/SNF-related matrix-associated actin-dependent regulator of chromatin subfamily A member 5